jgi:hypothetical protein
MNLKIHKSIKTRFELKNKNRNLNLKCRELILKRESSLKKPQSRLSYFSPVDHLILKKLEMFRRTLFHRSLLLIGMLRIRTLRTIHRATMGQTRTSSLAVLSINSDIKIDVDKVIDKFAKYNKNKRVAFD